MTEDGEHLRRRLYRPGADLDDVDAYLAVREPEPEPEPGAGTVPDAAPVPSDRGPRWTPVVALLVVAVAIVVVGVARAPGAISPASRATPLPTATIDQRTSASFVSRIRSDRDAGLAAWWDAGAPFVEEHGVGPRTVQLPPPSGSGRITVLLVLASDATAGWSIARLAIDDDRAIYVDRLRSATGAARAGVPAIGRLDYTPLTRPTLLLVRVPAGVRWGVSAVYSD